MDSAELCDLAVGHWWMGMGMDSCVDEWIGIRREGYFGHFAFFPILNYQKKLFCQTVFLTVSDSL
jgi:hypothetical protein